jgi:DNA modification methylase
MVINQEIGKDFAVYNADCVEVAKNIPTDSIHYSMSSIPFASLYTYSNSERDMGNCKSYSEFVDHFKFMLDEWYRVTMPGRLVSIHCMNLPTSKQNDGYIGLRDFRGDVIRAFQEVGFIYHSEVCIWKDPVIAMQRTKALGLLHKQIKKDSAMSRQGIPDYLVTFRKNDINPEPISHTAESFPVATWQRYADPCWVTAGEVEADGFCKLSMDINPSNTLQRESAREHNDERHICPLQLQVIERGIKLWSNHNDVIYDPFGGIGSTGFVALQNGRRTIMSELKESYYKQNVLNCKAAINKQAGLIY